MKVRKVSEFVVVLLAIAVFALVAPGARSPKAKTMTPKATELSIGGVKLGMTRQQVHVKLGPPLRTEEEIGIHGSSKRATAPRKDGGNLKSPTTQTAWS